MFHVGMGWQILKARLFSSFKLLHIKTQLASINASRVSLCSYALSIAALIVSTSLILSTGPSIQHYILSLVSSDAPSIYGSAYQDNLIRFPELRQWLLFGLHWPFLVLGAIVVLFSISRPTARDLLISSAVTAFISLMAYDLLIGLPGPTFTAGYLLENVISNTIGAPIFGFVFVAIILSANTLFYHLRGPRVFRQAFAGLTAIILGLLINTTIFYIAEFFYRPVPIKLDVILDYPTSGMIAADGKEGTPRKDTEKPFQFFAQKIDHSVIHWRGRGTQDELSYHWSSRSNSAIFDATIEFFADCISDKIDNVQSSAGDPIRISNVSSIGISLDGWSNFRTIENGKMSGRLVTEFPQPLMFWLDREKNSQKTEITQFVQKDARLAIWNVADTLSFFVNAPLVVNTDQGIASSIRTLRFTVNEKTYAVDSDRPETEARDSVLICRQVSPNNALKQDRGTIIGASNYLGVAVHINRRPSAEAIYGIEDNEFNVNGGNGWVAVTATSDEASDGQAPGYADFLVFKGNVASLDVDGISIPSRPIDEYHVFGSLNGRFEKSAKVRFSGVAKAFWKNSARANPTKWERLDWPQRLWIIATILGILSPIGAYTALQISGNAKIDWLTYGSSSSGLSKRY